MKDTRFGPEGWTPERLASLAGRTYVITGANAGAGFQAARILLSKGAKVVMLNRSAEKSTAAIDDLKEEFGAGADVSFVRTDLAELASVRDAAAKVLETVPRIDALICNAAIAQVPTRRLTEDGFESQLGTNHYGHFVLCGMLFDLALHGWTEPAERVRAAAAAAGVPVAFPRPGQGLTPEEYPTERWWPELPWEDAAEAPVVSTGIAAPVAAGPATC